MEHSRTSSFFYDESLGKEAIREIWLWEIKKFIDKIGEVEERKEEERSSN